MSKGAVVIDIGREAVTGAVFPHGSAEPGATASEPIGELGRPGAVRAVLEGLAGGGTAPPSTRADLAHAFAHHELFVSIHASELGLRVLKVPFQDRKKINATLPLELSGSLPYDIKDAFVEGLPAGGGHALAIAVERRVVGEALAIFESLGLDPAWMGPGFLEVPALVKGVCKTDGVTTYIADDFMVVGMDGKPAFALALQGAESAALAGLYMRGEDIHTGSVYASGAATAPIVEALGTGIRPQELKLTGGLGPEYTVAMAVGASVAAGHIKTAVNFRRGEYEYTRGRLLTRKRLARTGVLAAILLCLIFADVYIRYRALSVELASYRSAIADSYSALFPTERAGLADPVYSLRIKLKQTEREAGIVSGGVSPLDVLSGMAEAAASEAGLNVRITELKVTGSRAVAKGEAASFNAANSFKDKLSALPPFASVSISDLKSKPAAPGKTGERGASFSMTIDLKEAG